MILRLRSVSWKDNYSGERKRYSDLTYMEFCIHPYGWIDLMFDKAIHNMSVVIGWYLFPTTNRADIVDYQC